MTLAARFLDLSPERRGLVFEQAAAGLAGHAVILEKDFWVSWLLGLLFAQPELAPFLVFKGGTSLSKVFGVIDRFSAFAIPGRRGMALTTCAAKSNWRWVR